MNSEPPNAGRGCVVRERNRYASNFACRSRREGTVMLVCVFVIALISLMVTGILNALSVQSATTAITEQTDHARYAADAGIEHARSHLSTRPGWTGRLGWSDRNSKIASGRNRRRYQVTVTRDALGQAVVSSIGSYNSVRQQRTAIIPPGG